MMARRHSKAEIDTYFYRLIEVERSKRRPHGYRWRRFFGGWWCPGKAGTNPTRTNGG